MLILLITLSLRNFDGNMNHGNEFHGLIPDMIVVKTVEGSDENLVYNTAYKNKCKVLSKSDYLDYYILKVPEEDIDNILDTYRSYPYVLYADRIALGYAFWIPNDPYFPLQWHLDYLHLNMDSVWNIETGDTSIIIAVVDCGIAYEDYPIPAYEQYPKVQSRDGNYHIATDLIGVNFISGYDFVNDDSHPNDNNGHGTHVAGVIAQVTDNNLGMSGIAHDCSIMPVKSLDLDGIGWATEIADGIVYAANNGADIINLSLGGNPGDSTGWSVVHDAIIYARGEGAVVVASAGNSEIGELSYPAGYEQCISVAATDWRDSLAYYSQYGDGLDICAPGGDLLTDRDNDGQPDGILQQTFRMENDSVWVDEFFAYFVQGTSMSAPIVSAIAGLLKAAGYNDVVEIEDILFASAHDLGSEGYDTNFGWGLVDGFSALTFNDTIPPDFGILILRNSYLEKWFDLWVFSSDYLKGRDTPPDSVIIKQDGDRQSVELGRIDGLGRVYHSEFHLPELNDFDVFVSGVDATGNRGEDTRMYSLDKVDSRGGYFESPDKKFSCYIPEGKLNNECHILSACLDNYSERWLGINDEKTDIGNKYHLQSDANYSSGNIYIKMSYSGEDVNPFESKMAIFRWDGDNWVRLKSSIDTDGNVIYAESEKVGVFKISVGDFETEIIPESSDFKLKGLPIVIDVLRIICNVKEPGRNKISVYDMMGRRVKNLMNGYLIPGRYSIIWDGSSDDGLRLPKGNYIIRSQGINNKSIKVLLLK